MKLSEISAIAVALILGMCAASAQNGTNTPYSRFGYGMLRDNVTSTQQSMGGVGLAMHSGRQINVMNPASYARIDSLTFLFDMGIDISNQWRSDVDAKGVTRTEKHTGGGLNYITMQWPLGKRMGMSVGLLPYSAVGYAFGSSIDNGYTNRQGSGSINELYVGVAGRIIGNLTLGVNVAYMFGSTVNDLYAITSSGNTSLYENELTVRDWHANAGIQYTQYFGQDAFTLGLTFAPHKNFHGKIREYHYDVDADADENGAAEANEVIKTGHNYASAASYGAGLGWWHGQRIYVEADFTYQPWSRAKFNGVAGSFADRYKVNLGAQFTPALRGSYGRRIQYRVGAFFNRDYIVVSGNNVRQFGATCGVGLPVPGFKSTVNIGLEYLHRQAYPSALVKENYLNITIGVNFNEMWFRKSRIY
ncbi:MAG: hypothetical protein K2M19_03690 [Muribaculaceae bacterium]|nr:hypothetical protein [Muribaculaceae bacterium]